MKCHVEFVVLAALVWITRLEGASRVKRQSMSFMIVKNSTMPCEELESTQGPEVPRIQLNDDQKRQIFEASGGRLNTRLQAVTREEARRNFPNLIHVDDVIAERILKASKLMDKESSELTKDQITSYMMNHVYSSSLPHVRGSAADAHSDQKVQTSGGKGTGLQDLLDSVSQTDNKARRAALYERWSKEQHHLEGQTPFPLVFPEILGISRTQSDAHGSRSELEACLVRGMETSNPQYLRMCTVCMATTTLAPNNWPSYINEAACDATDNMCMTIDSVAHGMCQTISTTVDVLVQTVGDCTLALQNGQTVIAERWVMGKIEVDVGCECAINRNSYLANYL